MNILEKFNSVTDEQTQLYRHEIKMFCKHQKLDPTDSTCIRYLIALHQINGDRLKNNRDQEAMIFRQDGRIEELEQIVDELVFHKNVLKYIVEKEH